MLKGHSLQSKMYGKSVRFWISKMESVSVNKFRDNLKNCVEQVISEHEPLKVTRRSGGNFVVVSSEDWERQQETLYVLQNSELMRQIGESSDTHKNKSGFLPDRDELDEILGI